jgi:hypothetical protein
MGQISQSLPSRQFDWNFNGDATEQGVTVDLNSDFDYSKLTGTQVRTFNNLIGLARLEFIYAARSTQTFDCFLHFA